MKRAILVSAGTVAGLVASLSYTPGLLSSFAFARDDGPGRHKAAKTPQVASMAKEETVDAQSEKAKNSSKQTSGTNSDAKKSGGKSGGGAESGSASRSTQPKGSGGAGTANDPAPSPSSGSGGNTKPAPGPTKPSKPKPSPSPTEDPKPVTYVGSTASTAFGPVQVSIVVLDGRITDAQAIQYPKDDPQSIKIANKCLPKLRSETLAAQSADIATVSGASFTSQGWITSLQSALSKAKL